MVGLCRSNAGRCLFGEGGVNVERDLDALAQTN